MVGAGPSEGGEGWAAGSKPGAALLWVLPPETHALLKGAGEFLLIWKESQSTGHHRMCTVAPLTVPPCGTWLAQ